VRRPGQRDCQVENALAGFRLPRLSHESATDDNAIGQFPHRFCLPRRTDAESHRQMQIRVLPHAGDKPGQV